MALSHSIARKSDSIASSDPIGKKGISDTMAWSHSIAVQFDSIASSDPIGKL
jgi:hypothetical protein